MTRSKCLISWSSGKDSAWMVHVLRQRGDIEIGALLTTINEPAQRVAMHAVRVELLKAQAGVFITHIPYRGAGPALQDLIGGQVDMMFDGLGSSASHIKGGRIKALMVSGPKRNAAFPDVPCAAEVGLPDYTVTTWYGLWAPKGTPADVQARIVDEVRKLGSADELKTIWANNGAEYGGMTQQQFAGMVSSEVKRWAAVVKASGAKLD